MDKKTATEIAVKLAEANTALWNAICLAEELMKNDNVKKIINDPDRNTSAVKKIAKAFERLDKDDDRFINAWMNGRTLQDFDTLTNILKDLLET